MGWKQLDEPSHQEIQQLTSMFRSKARFLVDESVGIAVAKSLRASGYNVKYVEELGLRGRSDEDVFATAWKDRRIVITHDSDFLDNRRFPHHRNPGVVIIRPGSQGEDDHGLMSCLSKLTLLVGDQGDWLRGRKVEFTSCETLTITTREGRDRFLWRRTGVPMIWEDES